MKTLKLALLLALITIACPAFADPLNTAMQTAAVATGNGVAAQTSGAYSGEMIGVTGITTATITFEATVDDTNWNPVQGTNTATGAIATTATANGIYFVPVAGYTQLRARISAWTSGTITVLGRATIAPLGTVQSDGAGGTVSASQGTSPWVDNITQIGGSAVALGQTTMSSSVPVALASNQSALGVSPVAVTLTDRSLVTLGTSATQVAPQNNSRKSIELQNNNPGGGASAWISFVTTTPTVGGTGCIQVAAGGVSYTPPPGVIYTSACYAIAASGTINLTAVEGQ